MYEEDHAIFRDSVRKFVEKEVAPYHEQWEKDSIVPKSLWLKAGEAGLLSPTVPEEYGGPGCDFRYNGIVSEELARCGYTGPGFSLHSDIAVPYLVNYGSEEQKQEYLPKCVSGECIMAIAMTEPGTGSDLQGVKTTAKLDGNEYVINGSKTFITNGQNANLIIVVAKTDPDAGAKGTSLILVESHREGFKRGRNLEKLGMKAADTSELFFDEVRVPTSNCLGEENKGFIYLMQDLPQERLSVAVAAVAACEGALQWTLDYTAERKAFGKSISEFQNTKFKLAELKTEITIARVFVDRCLELHVNGDLDVETAAMAKLWTTDLQGKVMDECLQLHGGYGFMWEYPISRAYADARVQRIYAGTNEIMKEIISRKLWVN
ncbi:MAG: acyl-CoA dehydrogenase [Alphaproteobacteria bacterium]|nr:acyl-CoA dehydrogenase [Alphaproteobacteria bacterium]MBT4020030.1 acyl-CoA dehydrogenase [Alphaproteobacteria bacterium]MBT5161872.1 acyl-CoA dehydrogenase [Alphaproteobacteria bacterium]MBT5917152.1 acyl-CoA dehydrogenase [Alphaproteobacteria bacterium]MBT6387576.1 acyl-CoA dehydrogenase [Alphaproteobacteria bacterium]